MPQIFGRALMFLLTTRSQRLSSSKRSRSEGSSRLASGALAHSDLAQTAVRRRPAEAILRREGTLLRLKIGTGVYPRRARWRCRAARADLRAPARAEPSRHP